jgi:PAS domain S-box-containing protein
MKRHPKTAGISSSASTIEPFVPLDEKMYRVLIESMGHGLSAIDEHGTATYVNDRLCEMWGYPREEIIGRPVSDFLDPSNQRILQKQMAKRRRGEIAPYELVWTRKDGKKIHTNMSPTPFFDNNGAFKGSFAIITDISKRKLQQDALKRAHAVLEQRVKERTKELEIKSNRLEEMNTALRVLLRKRDEDRIELEEKMLSNVKTLILPYLAKLKACRLPDRHLTYVEIVESSLRDIIAPFARDMARQDVNLTPAQIQICRLITQGKTNKEIAEILGLSCLTISSHRKNIRRKMKITNKKINLRTHLAVFTKRV